MSRAVCVAARADGIASCAGCRVPHASTKKWPPIALWANANFGSNAIACSKYFRFSASDSGVNFAP